MPQGKERNENLGTGPLPHWAIELTASIKKLPIGELFCWPSQRKVVLLFAGSDTTGLGAASRCQMLQADSGDGGV